MAGVINIGADNASDQFYRYKMPKLQARVRGPSTIRLLPSIKKWTLPGIGPRMIHIMIS